ncbi:MAG: prepilin-type N-terminal cleavage/methylation domain-containing protein [Planctomycetaceae bacterium]|nr:prepilin-type N-terminal cleavage/methylation domain-containing protein [Planctomycetaceae bacterium]
MQRIHPTSEPRHSARAFTLTELVIALALTMFLVAAIFAATRLYIQTTTTGQRKVLKAQLTRSLIRQLQADLEGVVLVVPEEEDEMDDSSDDALTLESEDSAVEELSSTASTLDDETETSSLTEDPNSALSGDASGLVGTATQLVIHVNRPLHPMRLSSTTSLAAESLSGDEKSISWFMSGANDVTAANNFSVGGATTGLSRLEGDRFELDYADGALDSEQLSQLTKLLSPEVQELTFRYFDGQNWVDEWDSSLTGRLPQAVEVTFGFMLDDPDDRNIILGTTSAANIEYVTHVIRIPRAEPYVENLGL